MYRELLLLLFGASLVAEAAELLILVNTLGACAFIGVILQLHWDTGRNVGGNLRQVFADLLIVAQII